MLLSTATACPGICEHHALQKLTELGSPAEHDGIHLQRCCDPERMRRSRARLANGIIHARVDIPLWLGERLFASGELTEEASRYLAA